jgi:hypothetical protein
MYLPDAVPIRHPWFDKPSMKRKQPSSAPDLTYPSPKRRRSNTLERGFANLTLDAPMYPVDAIVPVSQEPPMPRPTTPIVQEVTMKTSSWYEPEPDRACLLQSHSDFLLSPSRHYHNRPRFLFRRRSRRGCEPPHLTRAHGPPQASPSAASSRTSPEPGFGAISSTKTPLAAEQSR